MEARIILFYLFAMFAGISCTGVKNMSGTLSKSDGKSTVPVTSNKHGDYLSSTSASDSAYRRPVSSNQYASGSSVSESQPGSAGTYRKDYGKQTGNDIANTGENVSVNSDYNQKLINHYTEMDKLGDVVLYELDITDRRWTMLLGRYKTADPKDREMIARDLDKLNADQLTLYRAYTHIYKNGKSDWSRVKNEVENTLINIRGLDKK